MKSCPPDRRKQARPRTRLIVSEPAPGKNGRWICTGKIMGREYGHLPWVGQGERPDVNDDDMPTATLFLVAGEGDSPEEARRAVLAKLRNVWGTESKPPPSPRIEEVDERPAGSLVHRLWRMIRR